MSKRILDPTILLIGEFDIPSSLTDGVHLLHCSVEDAKRMQPAFIDNLVRADAIIYRSNCAFTAETLRIAPNLRLIIKAGSGIENIDQQYCRSHGITVSNVPGANAQSVAELALWQALGLARYESLLAGTPATYGTELAGKTAVVYGYGHIGQTLATLLKAMGMCVTACGRTLGDDTRKRLEQDGVAWTPNVEEVLGTADYLFVTASLNPTSRNAIGATQLTTAKHGLHIVVISPAEILNQHAALAALEAGTIAALALDCAWEQPEPSQQYLVARLEREGRFVVTPRCGGNTKEALRRVSEAAWLQMQAFFAVDDQR